MSRSRPAGEAVYHPAPQRQRPQGAPAGSKHGSPPPGPAPRRRRATDRRLAPIQRIQAWWRSRLAPTDTHQLTQRNIYILPTRAGLMFALTLLTLLLASINYQLNLGHVLTFLLAGSGVVSLQLTHNTLRGLRLHLKPVAPVFAGSSAHIEVVLTAPASARRPRHGVGVGTARSADATSWVDVPAGGQVTTQLAFEPGRRGLMPMPRLTVQTRFPLGLFRAWTVWRPAASCLVYPRPEADAPALPSAAGAGTRPVHGRTSGAGEADGIRAYRRGDPLKSIVWRKAAKLLDAGGELLSRDSSLPRHQAVWLDWADCAPLPPEQRLSRLTAWVLSAERHGLRYGLALPGRQIAPDHGDAHRLACLESLALWS